MNVYGISNKSIKFFLNLFKRINRNEAINKFVEVEFKPQDQIWAKELMLKQFRDS
jgi:hypothetical protein